MVEQVEKIIKRGNNKCSQIDLLEVYAYPNSELTNIAQGGNLKAQRFTLEDGDLSTSHGRTELLLRIMLYRPKHVWMSPECAPWSQWHRFNSARSVSGYCSQMDATAVKNSSEALQLDR